MVTPGFYSQKVTLEGTVYVLDFRYNARMDRWIMDVSDNQGVLLLAGTVLVEGWGVTDRFIGRILGLPPGRFTCIDPTGAHREPTETLFTEEIPLAYGGA